MTHDTRIRPFRIAVPDTELDDLRDRLRRTRWVDAVPGAGWERGVPRDHLAQLVEYWRTRYDWRRQERRLNRLPQFTTTIDGQRFHFAHLRSPEPDALPLVLTHGWPSSFVEFLEVAGPLADPRSHGGDPVDAFHVVVPSVPGFGFSTPIAEAGWGNLFRVAGAVAELMRRLGYERFGAQGGDIGAGVAGMLGMLAPDRVVGTHTNGPGPFPFGPPLALDGLSDADRVRAERFNRFQEDGLGYLHLQATRPQTLGHALADSPAGQLAWIAEKYREWTDPAADLPEDAVDRDLLLTTASLYWFTGTGASSAHIIYEGMQAFRALVAQTGGAVPGGGEHRAPPTGVAVFAADHSIRGLLDPVGHVRHWSEFDRGGHFPGLETPDLLTGDIRAFFRQLRP